MLLSIKYIIISLFFYGQAIAMQEDIPTAEPPANVTHLRVTYEVTKLSFLENYPNLTDLNLSGNYNLLSLRGTEHLTKLRKLNVGGCSRLREISPLTALTNLEELDLRRIESGDLSFLCVLPKLKVLIVGPGQILPWTVSRLTNLDTLIIDGPWSKEKKDELKQYLPQLEIRTLY